MFRAQENNRQASQAAAGNTDVNNCGQDTSASFFNHIESNLRSWDSTNYCLSPPLLRMDRNIEFGRYPRLYSDAPESQEYNCSFRPGMTTGRTVSPGHKALRMTSNTSSRRNGNLETFNKKGVFILSVLSIDISVSWLNEYLCHPYWPAKVENYLI